MSVRPAQSRAGSLVEAGVNVVVGYVLALATQALVFPLFGIAATLAQDGLIAGVFTLVSLVRSYLLRRVFERVSRRSADEVFGARGAALAGS